MQTGQTVAAILCVCASLAGAAARSSSSAPAQAAATKPELVSVDAQRQTPAGARFTVPAGWSIDSGKNLVLLTPPEGDTHFAIFDTQAADAKAAVAAAWAAYKPGANRPIKLVTPQQARDGWDERQSFDYETSPNEKAVVVAFAERAGSAWTVVILDGSQSTSEKRGAQIGLIFESLRPKGYSRESFAGRKAHPLDEARIQQLKDFVQSEMKAFGVPGVAIAFIETER